jgi:hypothetical protein
MRKLSIAPALVLIVSCAPGPRAPDPEPGASGADPSVGSSPEAAVERHGRAPALNGRAMWTVESDTVDPDRCFGAAVAVGDLDGDGYRDVIVGETPCLLSSAPVRRVRIAIYRGGRSLPSTTPVWTEIDWQNLPFFVRLSLAVGDVDGDHRDDLLVSSQVGVQMFSGISNLAAPLGAPTFRVPGTGTFSRALLADVNGDHRDDIVSTRAGDTTVWLSSFGAAAGPFTAARVLSPASFVVEAGDTDHDGNDDLIVADGIDSRLFRGCRAHDRDCDGGLRTAPTWTIAQTVIGMIPDINHDGRSEALVTDSGFGAGRIWLYLSDRSTGGMSPMPVWSTLGDPGYPGFAKQIIVPGDLDGDHRATDFVVSSPGRVYAFFPRLGELAAMQPGFAWPREDTRRDQIAAGDLIIRSSAVVAAAGDVNRDHYDDLIIGDPSLVLGDQPPGRVHLVAGGRRPVHGDPPFLPGAVVCNLPQVGKPDLTVDEPALKRSLFVDNVVFAPDACEIAKGCVGGPGARRLLRFATSVANFGGAPAIIPGVDTAPELYHLNACEDEFEFELDGFSQFDLIDPTGATTTVGRKQSIFLVDFASNCINAGPSTDYLPDQGVTPGWGDVYDASTRCQWLDVTDVPDGRYTLRISIDVNRLIDQDDVLPDTASIDIELAGSTVTVLP